jgi:hypothetical protein
MFVKSPSTFHKFLKIIVQKTLLKAFLMSTYIMAQLKVQVEEGSNAKRDGFTTTRG